MLRESVSSRQVSSKFFRDSRVEYRHVASGKGVRGDAHVEGIFVVPAFAKLAPFGRVAVVGQHLKARQEFLELHFPVEDDAGGNNLAMVSTEIVQTLTATYDEMWTPDAAVAR